jgi:transposase
MTTPAQIRRLAVQAYRCGEGSQEEVAERFGVSARSLRRWLDPALRPTPPEPTRRGRKPKIGEEHQRLIEHLLGGWDPASGKRIARPSNLEIIQRLAQVGLEVSPSSLSRTLKTMGLSRRKRRAPLRDAPVRDESRSGAGGIEPPPTGPDLAASTEASRVRMLLEKTRAKTMAEALRGREVDDLNRLTGLQKDWLAKKIRQLPGPRCTARRLGVLRRYPGIRRHSDTDVASAAGVHARTVARARRDHKILPARPGTHADVVLAFVESEGSANEKSILDHVLLECRCKWPSTLSALGSLVDRGLLRADGDTYISVRSPDRTTRKDLLRRRRQHLRRRKPQSRSDQDQVEDIDF